MLFMNDYEIARAVQQYSKHPVLSRATRTLDSLAYWTDRNSDGWAYWPKPLHAAFKLMKLIYDGNATEEEYKAALRPIKAFRTRQKADFNIYI